jgi:DNA (cytosine-5)-methyltransferase 1
MPTFYEFFAGGGMARAGLGPGWECLFANDLDPKKAACYAANWGAERLSVRDVASLTAADLPGTADLAWASFPCQDLSLAGSYGGLSRARSGTFWEFWRLVRELRQHDRAPRTVVLENVCGALTSHGGRDFHAICGALAEEGYRFGPLVIDAARFLPQSRPRLFVVAFREGAVPSALDAGAPTAAWHTPRVLAARSSLETHLRERWVWWRLAEPPRRELSLADLIETAPAGVQWNRSAETARLIRMMSGENRRKLRAAARLGRPVVGTVYKRTRALPSGGRAQRAEVRFDGIAGCLRTPTGGSSRQTVLIVSGYNARSRLLSPREAARLMGLPEAYQLPANYNEAYHIAGDGVAVPAVRHLAKHLLEPLAGGRAADGTEAA